MEKITHLTRREREVLKLLGQGETSKQIAMHLGVSVQTVANHRKHICQKFNLHSTAELVAYAAMVKVRAAQQK